MDFQELKKHSKRNTLFGEILNHMAYKYAILKEDVLVSDFYVQDGFHSVTLKKNNCFVNIEVHENRIELKVDFILFCLFFKDYPKKILFDILDSAIEGKYEITEYESRKSILRKLRIVWDSFELESFNREEKISLKNDYEYQQKRKGINFLLQF